MLVKKQLALSIEYNPISQFFGMIEDGHWSCSIELLMQCLATLKDVSAVLLTFPIFLFFFLSLLFSSQVSLPLLFSFFLCFPLTLFFTSLFLLFSLLLFLLLLLLLKSFFFHLLQSCGSVTEL